MACKSWGPKDPDEVIDYTLDWQDTDFPVLEVGETIATSAVSVVSGTVVIDSSTDDGTVVTVWLSGGTEGEKAEILNRITTTGGRTYDQTVSIRIRSK